MSSRSYASLPVPDPYGPSRTKSIPLAEIDINVIMARAIKTGQFPPGPPQAPVFADVSQIGDFSNVQRLARLLPAAERLLAQQQKAAADKAEAVKVAAAVAAVPPVTPATPGAPPPTGKAS